MRRIARELTRIAFDGPSQDRGFLRSLAVLLDPDKPPFEGAKLTVTRAGAGAPKARPDWHLGHYMWAHVDALGVKAEAAAADARELFGISRAKAFAALKETRSEAERDPETYARHAETFRLLCRVGSLDLYPWKQS